MLSEQHHLTPSVTTIWYAAPEQLLSSTNYTSAVDIWSAGVALAELLLSEPLLPAEDPLEQLSLVAKNIGSPTEEDLMTLCSLGSLDSHASVLLKNTHETTGTVGKKFDFLGRAKTHTVAYLSGLLKWNPRARWRATDALACTSIAPQDATNWWEAAPTASNKQITEILRQSKPK